jgi:23S rRNA (uracil1939-C5)-methyltransferase
MNCFHFGLCGGCLCRAGEPGRLFRPMPYAEELDRKEKRVHDLLAGFTVEEWRAIVPSPEEWYYRNKMEYAFGVWDEQMVLGLREAGRFDHIVDLQTCFLLSPESLEVLKQVRQWATSHGLTGYHRRRHEGDLRYLVLREGKNTGERMAILIATGKGARRCAPTPPTNLQPLLSTFWLGVTDSRSDVARTDDMRLLWGSGTMDEKLGSITYRISPYSFFQTNTHGTEKLYDLLKDWAMEPHPNPLPDGRGGDPTALSSEGEGGEARVRRSGVLIDLYCGSGGIALALAGGFDRVIGIDTNALAIEDAKANAERNGLANTEFVCEDAQEFLKKLPASKVAVQLSALVVDPPRAGLHPQALRALLKINPPRLAYVSCNPESLARDLQPLVPFYTIRSVQPVDLFPHTAHVETLVIMEHR